MRAYVILAGGGVRGAALAGCLKAAEDNGIEIAGYAGTSAGSVVALLAAIGYTPDELKGIMSDELKFQELLDGGPEQLKKLSEFAEAAEGVLSLGNFALWNQRFLRRLKRQLGIYSGDKFRTFLRKKIIGKYPHLDTNPDPKFSDLRKAGCRKLKIVTSNLRSRRARMFFSESNEDDSVVDAVRASMSYPFVFMPVKIGTSYFADGGLSSNLPIFAFEDQRLEDHLPVIAFDLVSVASSDGGEYAFKDYCSDILATALESGQALQRDLVRDLHYFPIAIPTQYRTLDFELGPPDAVNLYNIGRAEAGGHFADLFRRGKPGKGVTANLQFALAPPALVTLVLHAFAKIIEEVSAAQGVRAHIMLPTDRNTRVVTYQYGMDNDEDRQLELGMEDGCSGQAWRTRTIALANLEEAQKTWKQWGLTETQQSQVRKDRKTMISAPMFRGEVGKPEREGTLIGILSADSGTPFKDTGWSGGDVHQLLLEWASVFARLLY